MNNNLLINNFARLTQSPENVAELKKLVLQLAVQGKLTENWRNSHFEGGKGDVETGTQLLQKIKAEKQELIKQGKLKRQKPLPQIEKNEIPFEIPESWVWTRLGVIVEMIYGSSLTKAQCIEGAKYPVYGSNGIVGFYNKFLTDKKSIIVGRKGSSGALNISEKPSWTTDVSYYIQEKNNLEFSFLFHLLKSLGLEKMGKGIKPGLNRNEFNLLVVTLPPLAEQKAIVSTVESILKKIDQLHEKSRQKQALQQKTAETLLKRINSQNSNLQEDWQLLQNNFGTLINQKQAVKKLRQSILQLAVQGKLTENWRAENKDLIKETGTDLLAKIKDEKEDLIKTGKLKRQKPQSEISEDEKSFKIPESWVWTRLGEIFEIILGQSPTSDTYNKSKKGLPFYQGKKEFGIIYPKSISVWCSKPKRTSIIDDILFSVRAPVGDVNISDNEFAIGRGLAVLRTNKYFETFFAFHYLTAIKDKWKVKGAFFDAVNKETLLNGLIVFPPLAEQKAIVSQIEKLLKMCDSLEQKITESENLNKKLMQTIVKEYT